MKSVRISAYAKVNLRLDVLGRRADGYHELRTIFQTISLHDTLVLDAMRNRGVELHIDGNVQLAGEPGINNLVYRALDELSRELGLRQGVRAQLTKRIPVGRGMGGGSSDAAAALLGLLRLTGKRVPLERLMSVASGLGSDVPFFLQGGRALGIGRGEEIYPLPDVPKRTVLVVSPREIAVPTKDAYRWISEMKSTQRSEQLTNGEDPSRLLRFCALCWSPQGGALSNDFEAAVFPRYPRLDAIKRELLQQGAAEASLAGSGSAVFGIYQHPAKARRAARAFPQDQVFLCATLSRVEYRRKMGAILSK
ncbi:MAG TPA: 4-(cytidine 5'-diphospho)-2-C-methyl-D-erythritol kinase [Candidatus Acidoferrales bacterium]|jgi:4-diphosphocytidyl-2-C-methyl-D-erythritol kinase|nr:4-(cytidine 5'-diphospho)-2-C-methyl-D-erythritol kinase [Candidatus Acidoferrales bacterium]